MPPWRYSTLRTSVSIGMSLATRDTTHSLSLATKKIFMMSTTEDDPFDSLLTLEDKFYKEGYDLGVSDGNRAGLIEGRFFGLEKGFEKYASMGKFYGRAVIWTGRLANPRDTPISDRQDTSAAETERFLKDRPVQKSDRGAVQPEAEILPGRTNVPGLPSNLRLEKHIRTLYALTEPESLSTANDVSSVSEFDDRFNRAEGKIKIIDKLTGETGTQEISGHPPSNPSGLKPKEVKVKRGDGGIEDISSLHARH